MNLKVTPRAAGAAAAESVQALDLEGEVDVYTAPVLRQAILDQVEAGVKHLLIDLTRVEFRLLSAILGADGRVLSRDQLLDAVYGHEAAEVMDRTIDVHIRRLRDKLDDDPEAPRYVQTVRGVGYRAART